MMRRKLRKTNERYGVRGIDLDIPGWESLSAEQKREVLLEKADALFESSSIEPTIQECSDPEVGD